MEKRRILFFIGALVSGGKERRFIELLSFLKAQENYEMLVILTSNKIRYPKFNQLNISYHQIKNINGIKIVKIPFEIYKISMDFKPDIVHTWGRMQTFYSLPLSVFGNIPIVNSQITNAPPKRSFFNKTIDFLNFKISKVILSNSIAGVESYLPPANKTEVVYNGMNLERFRNLPDVESVKIKFKIKTKYSIAMVASFSNKKNYKLFFSVANILTRQRNDVTFLGVGYYEKNSRMFKNLLEIIGGNPKIIITGEINEVEALANTVDIGVLFSADIHGEGLSNAILEFIPLGKPVMANNDGGTKELIKNGVTGYLIEKETPEDIASKLSYLLDNKDLREELGSNGIKFVNENITIQQMGKGFVKQYEIALGLKNLNN